MVWTQFRRLLLGTMVEIFQDQGISTDVTALELDFHEGSAFKVPRIDNYMRFKGHVRAPLSTPLSETAIASLERELLRVWPDLLQVVKIPIGDRLEKVKNRVRLQVTPEELRIEFDLIAD